MNKHRRGNPNWCSANSCKEVTVSDWERMRMSLGLTEAEAIKSPAMKAWAKDHKFGKFVPEDALEAWGWRIYTV